MNRKRYTLFLIGLLTVCASFAQPFMKSYDQGTQSAEMFDLIRVNNGGYAFIGPRRLVVVNNAGEIANEWSISDPAISFLQLAKGANNKIYLTATKENFKGFILYILSENATLEDTRTYELEKPPFNIQLIAGEAGAYTYSYVLEQEGKAPRLFIHHMNAAGTQIWSKIVAEGIYFNYKLRSASNGTVELAFIAPEEVFRLKLLKFSATGISTEKIITEIFHEGEADLPYTFSSTPDGGYLFGSTEYTWEENSDLLLLKTDGNGNVQWKKLLDINMTDALADIVCTNDAIYLLSNSGTRANWQDKEGQNDMVLAKIDLQGNFVWKRGYGSNTGIETAVKLVAGNNELLIGCYGSLQTNGLVSSILIRTGMDGLLNDHAFTNQLQPFENLKKINLQLNTSTDELIASAPLQDGGTIALANVKGKTERDYSVCAFRTNAQGQKVWISFLSDFPARATRLCPTSDGNFVTLLTVFEGPWKLEYAVKLSPNGQVLWQKDVWSLAINDITAAPDGSIYITGTKLIAANNYSLLIKLDAAGNEVWTRTYEYPNRWVAGKCVNITPEGDIIVAGSASIPFGPDNELYLLHVGNDGMPLRAMLFSKPDTLMTPKFVVATADRHFLVGGITDGTITGNRDAWLMKVTHLMARVWNHAFDIGLTDAATCLIERGDSSYCLAGTTGEPEFGTIKKFGFLANIRKDGTMNGIKYFGRENAQLNILKVAAGTGNRLLIAGSLQDPYFGVSVPYTSVYDPDIILSTGDRNNIEGVKLYPNPAKGAVWLTIENQETGKVQLSITDSRGVQVKHMMMNKPGTVFTTTIPLQKLPSGIYQVEIWLNKKRMVKRLVVVTK